MSYAAWQLTQTSKAPDALAWSLTAPGGGAALYLYKVWEPWRDKHRIRVGCAPEMPLTIDEIKAIFREAIERNKL